jgi:hypothetical protein
MTNQDTQIIPISDKGELVYTQWDQLTRISKQIMDAGITKLGNPTQINLIILKGRRLGLDMFEALENISVINNKTSINGALASALVERSGLLVDKSHEYTGDSEARKCSVTVQRKDRKPATWSFTIKEAKQAGLYPGKQGSGWSNYPDSMLYWRALGFCYRREFSDVLQGMYLTEELVDEVPEVKVVTDAPSIATGRGYREVPKTETVPFEPDPEDPKAHQHPIISAPSDIPAKEIPLEKVESTKPENPVDSSTETDLEHLKRMSEKSDISEELLIEIVNGLRLFPRGVEHKLESLPEAKIKTLIKNWNVVMTQAKRITEMKEAKAKAEAEEAAEAAAATGATT